MQFGNSPQDLWGWPGAQMAVRRALTAGLNTQIAALNAAWALDEGGLRGVVIPTPPGVVIRPTIDSVLKRDQGFVVVAPSPSTTFSPKAYGSRPVAWAVRLAVHVRLANFKAADGDLDLDNGEALTLATLGQLQACIRALEDPTTGVCTLDAYGAQNTGIAASNLIPSRSKNDEFTEARAAIDVVLRQLTD